MAFIHNISMVAHYEAITLRRSWFFRLFSVGAVVIFTFMNIGLFSPVGDESWRLIAIPSSVPLVNLYLLNIGQALVVIFLAADFLRRDKKLDTNEVLYTRSMSNLEYVSGKTLGILRLFISLDLLILAIALVINIISKRMSVDILSYFEYLLIISVPTIVFSLGLAFMLMSLIRNQAITFLLLLGYAALDIFYLWFRAGFIFDYMAFGLPVFKSGMIGYENPSFIINQRLIYLCLGLMMVFITVLLFRRLPQSRIQRQFTVILAILAAAGSGLTIYNTWSSFASGKRMKEDVIAVNRQYEHRQFPSMIKTTLDVLHRGGTIEVTAGLVITNENETPLDRYVFSLNPELKISGVARGSVSLPYSSNGHITEIKPDRPLLPGQTDSLTISYSGAISESFCYPNYSDNFRDYPYRIDMLNVNKRQAFLTDEYVLLTPETHWYPVAGLNYYPSNPARIKVDFSRYTLRTGSEKGLVAVSQGVMHEEGGRYIYNPGEPLTGLTLAMGNYLMDSIRVDSVKYITWYYKGNDYFRQELSELKDTLKYLVSGIMRELETNFTTKYPFKTLTLTEVPVQFYSFPKKNTQTRAELQPSLVLLPERLSTLDQAGFGKRIVRQKRQMARNNQVITDKEIQVRIFNSFVRNTFISGENFRFRDGVAINEPIRFRLGPSFYFYKNNFHSDEYPVINAVFESHLQKVATPGRPMPFGGMFGSIGENDKANLIMRNMSFRDLLALEPGIDTLSTILTVKGDYLFNLLRKNAGIEEFRTWFLKYIEDNKFKRVNILTFNNDIKEKFGFEFYPLLENWFNGKEQPGFLITGLQANEVVVGERSRYLVTFIASNPENAGGLFNVAFRTGGPGGRDQMMKAVVQRGGPGGGGGGGMMRMAVEGRGMEASDISKIVYLGPNEAKKISITLDNQPRAMIINTLFSKNLPGEITLPVDNIIKIRERTTITDREELLAATPPFTDPHEIITDNEDSLFVNNRLTAVNPLKKLLGVNRRRGEVYGSINLFDAPDFWQPVIQTNYYGKYIRSAVYTRSGTGDKSVTWQGIIGKPGYYDVYAYIGKAGDRVTFRTGQGPGPQGGPGGPGFQDMEARRDNPYKDFHYRVYHDEGEEEITIEFENAEPGWNKLGTYYLSPDTVKVSLSNQTTGRIVIGDAVKWVMQR